MTEPQLDSIKGLAERYHSTLEHTDVMHNNPTLPKGWVSVVVFSPEAGVAPHLCKSVVICGGVSPDGGVST